MPEINPAEFLLQPQSGQTPEKGPMPSALHERANVIMQGHREWAMAQHAVLSWAINVALDGILAVSRSAPKKVILIRMSEQS